MGYHSDSDSIRIENTGMEMHYHDKDNDYPLAADSTGEGDPDVAERYAAYGEEKQNQAGPNDETSADDFKI